MKRFIVVVLVIVLVMIFMVPIAFADSGGTPNGQACLGQLRRTEDVSSVIQDWVPPPAALSGVLAKTILIFRSHSCT